MRLLRADADGNVSLTVYHDRKSRPKYAILSHTWESDDQEVQFQDIIEGRSDIAQKAGYRKLDFCNKQARMDGYEHFWIDSCCIDQRSSAEVSQVVNSMFRIYQEAAKCYVYLADVSAPAWHAAFYRCKWFTRGWTLQELIAPEYVAFFSREGIELGNREELKEDIYRVTSIPLLALKGGTSGLLSQFSVSERMSWAADRETRVEEDKAYCLLGIFDIHMPLVYGEGEERAFIRLQDEIDKRSDPSGLGQVNWTHEERKCLRTLYDPNYHIFREYLPLRVDDTCSWFFEHKFFKDWCESLNDLLWLSAKPDSGKSVLAKSLSSVSTRPGLICYFFFNPNDPGQTSASSALSAILHQLFLLKPRLIKHALPHSALEGKRLRDVFYKLWLILVNASRDSENITCILDGLDKCEIDGANRLLRSIVQLRLSEEHLPFSARHARLKFLVTSRYGPRESSTTNQRAIFPEGQRLLHIDCAKHEEAIAQDVVTVIKRWIANLDLPLARAVPVWEKSRLQEELLAFPHETYAYARKIIDTVRGNQDPENPDVLHTAVLKGLPNLLKLLITTGGTLHIDSIYQNTSRTPLSFAAELGYSAVVERLVQTGQVNTESMCKDGLTPLHYAAKHGQFEVVRALLLARVNSNSGALSPNAAQHGLTPLMLAAINGHKAVARMLLFNAAAVYSKDRYQRTALSHAAAFGHDEIVALLIQMRADVNHRSGQPGTDGCTPLMYAAASGHVQVVKQLLAVASVDVTCSGTSFCNPPDYIHSEMMKNAIGHARTGNHENVVKLLCAHLEQNTPKGASLKRLLRG